MDCLQVNGLTLGKTEDLIDDLDRILEEINGMSFLSFKEYWQNNNLSLIHQSLHPREDRQVFYHTISRHLLEFVKKDPNSLSALYVLYTIYFTQTACKVKILIDPDSAQALHALACYFEDAASIVSTLSRNNAFMYGMKHEEIAKRAKKEPKIPSKHEEVGQRIEFPEIEFREAEELCREYNLAKARSIQKIQENLELFQSQDFPENEIACLFTAENSDSLKLSDPAFIYNIEAEYDIATDSNAIKLN